MTFYFRSMKFDSNENSASTLSFVINDCLACDSLQRSNQGTFSDAMEPYVAPWKVLKRNYTNFNWQLVPQFCQIYGSDDLLMAFIPLPHTKRKTIFKLQLIQNGRSIARCNAFGTASIVLFSNLFLFGPTLLAVNCDRFIRSTIAARCQPRRPHEITNEIWCSSRALLKVSGYSTHIYY